MAKSTRKVKDGFSRSAANEVRWVNVRPTDDMLVEFEAWVSSDPDVLSEILRLVSSGFAFGCKPTPNGDGFMATLISPAGYEGGGNCGLSAYADTPYDAVAGLLYKFVGILGSTFPAATDANRPRLR